MNNIAEGQADENEGGQETGSPVVVGCRSGVVLCFCEEAVSQLNQSRMSFERECVCVLSGSTIHCVPDGLYRYRQEPGG